MKKNLQPRAQLADCLTVMYALSANVSDLMLRLLCINKQDLIFQIKSARTTISYYFGCKKFQINLDRRSRSFNKKAT